jgi:hypothetical protein
VLHTNLVWIWHKVQKMKGTSPVDTSHQHKYFLIETNERTYQTSGIRTRRPIGYHRGNSSSSSSSSCAAFFGFHPASISGRVGRNTVTVPKRRETS